MKKVLYQIMICLLILCATDLYAQKEKIVGFWGVQQVLVGEQVMTPVAKWFRINPDGTYEAGNGWLQNGEGTWSFNAETNIYTPVVALDIQDEYGGFNVSFADGKMYWEREEEGMQVQVSLIPIETLPMSPADYLEGVWQLVSIDENGLSVQDDFDNGSAHKFFFRWDRIYIELSPESSRKTGYWHINGHRPEITLLPHQEGGQPESWRIEVNEEDLIMTGISDTNRDIQKRYERRRNF